MVEPFSKQLSEGSNCKPGALQNTAIEAFCLDPCPNIKLNIDLLPFFYVHCSWFIVFIVKCPHCSLISYTVTMKTTTDAWWRSILNCRTHIVYLYLGVYCICISSFDILAIKHFSQNCNLKYTVVWNALNSFLGRRNNNGGTW